MYGMLRSLRLIGAGIGLLVVLTTTASARPLASAPARLASPTSRTAPDGSGATFVVWNDIRSSSGSGVYAQKLDAAGVPQWTLGGVPVCLEAGVQSYTTALPDGAGGVFLAWQDDRSGDLSNADLYVQRLDAAGNVLWTAGGVAVCTAASDQRYPVLASDGGTGVLVCWQDDRSLSTTDVYAQRVNASGASQWTADGVVVSAAVGDQYYPVAVSDDAGGAVVAWQDTRAGAGRADIYAQRIGSNGAPQWAVNGIAVVASADLHVFPVLASDGAGGGIVAWEDSRNVAGDDVYAQRVSALGDIKWTANGVVVCAATGHQSTPALVADGAGGAVLAWTDHRNSADDNIYAQRVDSLGAAQWTANGVALCAAVNGQAGVVLASDGAGGAIAAWQDLRASAAMDVYAQRVNAAGAVQWTANGVVVCNAGSYQFDLMISADPAGGAVVSWADYRSRLDLDLYAQRLDGAGAAQWSANGQGVHVVGEQLAPVIAAVGGGGTISAWMEKRNGEYDIRARKQDLSGNLLWPAATVCSAGDLQQFPAIASDGAGGAILVWWDFRNGTDYGDLYAQRVGADGSLLWTANGVAVCTAAQAQEYPAILSDGLGGAYIVWQDMRLGAADLYMQRLNAAGVPQWPTDGVALCSAVGNQWYPALASDGANGVLVAWQDVRDASDYRIYAQRVDTTGADLWTAGGVSLSGAAGGQAYPSIVSDSAAGAIVTWQDRRASNDDIYAQRIDANGVVKWSANGVAVVVTSSAQMNPAAAPDGFGGAVVVWRDQRNTTDFDLYAQQLDSTGVTQWAFNGVSVCAAAHDQSAPVVVQAEAGSVIVAWSDLRNGLDAGIYAQRLDVDGAPQWPGDGVLVADSAWNQLAPALAGDGANGGVLAWQDGRSGGESFVYTQRFNASGAPMWHGGGVVPTLLSFHGADLVNGVATLSWYGHMDPQASLRLFRCVNKGDYVPIATLADDGNGFYRYRDDNLVPGVEYGYMVSLVMGGYETIVDYAWLAVPVRSLLALEGLRPNPAAGELRAAFSLAGRGDARLELLDIAGRVARTWPLGDSGAGTHLRSLGDTRGLAPGVYLMRLSEGGARVQRRVTIVR